MRAMAHSRPTVAVRDAERRRRLGNAESREVAQLHQPGLLRIQDREARERVVEREHVHRVDGASPQSARVRRSASPSETCTAPPPRLSAWRVRAWSTSTRRIICAAMAKNCVRLSHRASC